MLATENKQERLIYFCVAFCFLIAFFGHFINILYRVNNNNLKEEIEKLEDEKSLLRTRYLSDVSYANLNSHASQMQMQHATEQRYLKVSASLEESRKAKLAAKKKMVTKKAQVIVSGY